MTDWAYTIELNKAGDTMIEPFIPDVILDTLGTLGAGIEDEDRGESSCPRIDFSAWATPETEKFLAGVINAEDLYVSIYEYDAQFPVTRYRRFFGRLVELPRRGKSSEDDVFIFSAAGLMAFYDEVDVIDPVSGNAYRDVHCESLIPTLTAAAGHVGGLSVNAGAPITTAGRWTSRLFYPGKHRFGGTYSTTDRITGMCNDSTYIYLGVGHWLCRYNPTNRECIKLAHLNYTGSVLNIENYQFRISHIVYSAGNVLGWAESITSNLKKSTAHAKISFTWAAGNLINLSDANLIYCHDRGYYVRSHHVQAINRGGETGTDFAQWRYKQIGEAQPPSDKTLGVMLNEIFQQGITNYIEIGHRVFDVSFFGVTGRICIGDRIFIKATIPVIYQQNMGRVIRSQMHNPHWWTIETEFNIRGPAELFTEVLIFEKGEERAELNLVLPAPREIKVEYEQPQGMASAKPISVTVERRRTKRDKPNFFWPERLGDASEHATIFAPGPYVALGECNTPEEYKTIGANKYYVSENVPYFFIWIDDAAHFANLPAANYWVQNDAQYETAAVPEGSEGPPVQPGENTLMYNGAPVTIENEADTILRTRGNIFLAEENGRYYVAWNRWRFKDGDGFLQAVWGVLHASEVKIEGHNRDKDNYQSRPPREIVSFKVFNGRYWFGIRRTEPRWVDTAMQIIAAMPPQTELKPNDYDGGLVVTCLVTFDKTEYLRAGDLIRVRNTVSATPRDKEYLISEVEVIPPLEITTTTHSYRTYGPEVRTRLVLFSLESFEYTPTKYQEVAKKELADTFITIMQGWDIRGEICYANGYTLTVGHTATAAYGEAFEGDYYDWQKKEWRGETITPEPNGPMPYATLSEERVVPGSLTATLVDGKKNITVTDKTSYLRGELPIPPLGEIYAKHREGDDFNETILYFNPAYLRGERTLFLGDFTLRAEGMPFDIQYRYYTNRLFVEPFIVDDALYFNETETGAIYRRDTDTTWVRAGAWPAEIAKVDVFGDEVYALAANDYALMRYGKSWPGYINADVGGAEPIDIYTALTKIAQTMDCFLGEENGKILFRPRGQSYVAVQNIGYENYESLKYLEQKQYRGVLFTYNDGKAYVGQNDPPDDLILKRDANYVYDYGLAYELARRYYEYFSSGAVVYDLETARESLALPILAETVNIGAISGRLISYKLNGPKIGMYVEKTIGGRLGVGTV